MLYVRRERRVGKSQLISHDMVSTQSQAQLFKNISGTLIVQPSVTWKLWPDLCEHHNIVVLFFFFLNDYC